MDNFRALPKLNEKLEDLLRGTQARIAKVVGVYGSEVEVEMTGGARARYATTQTSVPIGQPGIIVSGFGNTGIFIPLHMSNPLGKQHYDKGNGIQIGSVDPDDIVSGTAFIEIAAGTSAGTIDGNHAIGIGVAPTAVGSYAIAIGSSANSSATGTGGIAIGRLAEATENSAVAIGNASKAKTNSAVAIGYLSDAAGLHGVAVGRESKTTAGYAVAVGYDADAGYSGTGYGEVAIGRSAKAKYARSIAIGHGATAQQHYDGVIAVNTLRIEPQTRNYSKLGLRRHDGTQVYLYISNTNEIIVNTSW